MDVRGDDGGSAGGQSFLTTRWSMVRAASSRPLGESQAGDVRDALESLCEGYWFPLYGYVRRKGHTADEARDLTQAFFARLLDKRDFDAASPEHGRFRAFLLASLRNFLSNERDRQRALKRGGGEVPLSIDARDADSRYSIDIGHELTPERAFERAWALALLDRALSSVRETYAERDQVALFEALEGTLGGHEGEEDRASLAERLGMTEGALNVAAHRLRRTFRERLRAEIAGTVSDPGDVEDELAALFDALGR